MTYLLRADGHHDQDVKRVLEVPAFYRRDEQTKGGNGNSVYLITTSRDKTAKTWFPSIGGAAGAEVETTKKATTTDADAADNESSSSPSSGPTKTSEGEGDGDGEGEDGKKKPGVDSLIEGLCFDGTHKESVTSAAFVTVRGSFYRPHTYNSTDADAAVTGSSVSEEVEEYRTVVVTASNDKTVAVWDAESSAMEGILAGHTDVVYSVASLAAGAGPSMSSTTTTGDNNSSTSSSSSLIVTGSWDHSCIVWDLNGLVESKSNKQINTNNNNNQVLTLKFQKHSKAVMCVAAFVPQQQQPQPSTTTTPTTASVSVADVLSGGADGLIYRWSPISGKVIQKFNHGGHTVQAVVTMNSNTNANNNNINNNFFAAADNSGAIRQWDAITGAQIAHIPDAHEGFVYGLACNPLKQELISCGEDRMVKVWSSASSASAGGGGNDNDNDNAEKQGGGNGGGTIKYHCAQVIPHPQLVWSVCCVSASPHDDISTSASSTLEDAGGDMDMDIATACYDGFVRVFTRNPAESCSAEKLQLFQDLVSTSELDARNTAGGGAPAVPNAENLPPVESVHQTEGTHEGQKLLARAPNGDIEVFIWSGGKWEKVGTVVSGPGQGSGGGAGAGAGGTPTPTTKKQHTDGKWYDYLLPIQLPGVETTVNLPYNRGQSVYDAAQEFINEYAAVGVSQMDIEPIREHILSQISQEDAALIGAAMPGAASSGAGGAGGGDGGDAHASEFAREAAAMAAAGGGGVDHRSWQDDFRRLQEGGGEEVAFSQYAKEAAEAKAAAEGAGAAGGDNAAAAASAPAAAASASPSSSSPQGGAAAQPNNATAPPPVGTATTDGTSPTQLIEQLARQYYNVGIANRQQQLNDAAFQPITAWSGAGCLKKLTEFGVEDVTLATAVTANPTADVDSSIRLVTSFLSQPSRQSGQLFPALDILRYLVVSSSGTTTAAATSNAIALGLTAYLPAGLLSSSEIDRRVAFRCLHNLLAVSRTEPFGLRQRMFTAGGSSTVLTALRTALTSTSQTATGSSINYVKTNNAKTVDDLLTLLVAYLVQCRLHGMVVGGTASEEEEAMEEAHSELTTIALDAIGAIVATEVNQDRQIQLLKLAIILVYYRTSSASSEFESEKFDMNQAVCLSHLQGEGEGEQSAGKGEGEAGEAEEAGTGSGSCKILPTLKIIQQLYDKSHDGAAEHTLTLEQQTDRNYFEKHVKHNTNHVFYIASSLMEATRQAS